MTTTRARTLLVGVVVALAGVLLLFLPHSTTVQGARLSCGSAAAPADLPTTFCGTDGRRFAAVATMSGGALIAVVAGLWPALRPAPAPAGRPDQDTGRAARRS